MSTNENDCSPRRCPLSKPRGRIGTVAPTDELRNTLPGERAAADEWLICLFRMPARRTARARPRLVFRGTLWMFGVLVVSAEIKVLVISPRPTWATARGGPFIAN